MDEEDRPESHLRLASERTDEQIELSYVKERLRAELREHAANLIRIVRGAGNPFGILEKAENIAALIRKHEEITGWHPSEHEITAMLHDRPDYSGSGDADPEWIEKKLAQRAVVRGALQLTASELVGQATQQRRGESEMIEGMRRWEEARARSAAEVRSEMIDFQRRREPRKRPKRK